MKTGNGKIANLPPHIRDELNHRLTEGEPGTELVAWLNAKPEVVKVLRERFDGIPISEQNLSEWRKHGYQKWLAFHNLFDASHALSGDCEVLAETGIDCEKLLLILTAAYAEMIQNWVVTSWDRMDYKLGVFKNLTNGVMALRRAEIQKVRLEIERERLELLREKRRGQSASSASSVPSSSPGAPTTAGVSSSKTGRPKTPEEAESPRSVIPDLPRCKEALTSQRPPPSTTGSPPAMEGSPAAVAPPPSPSRTARTNAASLSSASQARCEPSIAAPIPTDPRCGQRASLAERPTTPAEEIHLDYFDSP
jgi:hypothetical protein